MLKHNGVYLRAIEEQDLSFLSSLRNDDETWPYLGTLNFTNEPKQRAWFEKSSLDSKQENYIYCLDGNADEKETKLGFIRMDEKDLINRSIRVGGDIALDYRGQGYGKKMYDLIFKYTFDYLNMHRVWLLVASYNMPARKLYKKVGMREEGILRESLFREGMYNNSLIMSILEPEYIKLTNAY